MPFQDDDNPWASGNENSTSKPSGESFSKKSESDSLHNKKSLKNDSHNRKPGIEDFMSRFQQKLKQGGNNGGHNQLPSPNPGIFILLGIGILIVWLASGLFRVQEGELGVVLRFGEMVRIVQPGLQYRFPYPFEQEIVRKVSVLNKIDGGGRDNSPSRGESSDQNLVLTNDENMVQTNYTILWKIRDLSEFLFTARDPEATIRVAGESTLREVIGQTAARLALTEGRETIGSKAQDLLQRVLDQYKIGVQIVSLQLQRVEPPSQVITAYNDMQASVIDEVRFGREAEAYENDRVPRARGEAERIIQEAEAYKKQVVLAVEGEAARFNSILQSYKLNPEITRQRMYLETMQNILSKVNKTIVDGKVGQGIMPYYNLQPTPKLSPPIKESSPKGGQ